jgi:PAS domain S-box-containing protein
VQSTADNFQKVLDFAPEPIVLHYGGRFIYSNRAAAELAGAKSGDELRGRPIEPDQSSKSEVEERLRRLQNGETLPPAVFKYKDITGRVISLEVASTLVTYKGSPAIITACRDVTKRQAEEEELRRSKKEAEDAVVLKDKYLALVSDDLRSPLASVKALLNNLLEKTGLRKGVDVPTTVGKALSDCDSMLMTIDNILNAGKVRGGNWRLNLEPVDARLICEEAVSGLLPLAQSKGIEVVNDVPEGRSFRVDKGLFLQVVQNLASNAIKFSGKGDTVTIFIPDGKENAIAVKDTGSGILPEILKDIFSANVRTTSVGSKGETGHGVGLPLCQDIMTAHRGRLTAESQPGAGSLFVAELPSSKPRVLVVEDDPATRFLLCLELAQRNMEVIEAANGESALKVLGDVKPDLIITDLDMPSMDGVTFIGHARQDRTIAAVPIVVYSSGGPENRKAAIEKGANEFVHKSRPAKELMLVVARHFA